MINSKNEIQHIIEKYKLFEDFAITNDETIKRVIQRINDYSPFEKPDAFLEDNGITFGIEHFQVSLYKKQKNSDISKIAEGCNRAKMKNDRNFDFQPSVENLLSALKETLESHSKSFEAYRNNLQKEKESEYRLIIFVEDSSEAGYIVRKRENSPINPLLLKQIAEIFLEYKDEIWGVIFITGNELQKMITGCTLTELNYKLNNNELYDAKDYVPLEIARKVHKSKNDSSQDSNHVTIQLFDRL